jgi:hypothetical protein
VISQFQVSARVHKPYTVDGTGCYVSVSPDADSVLLIGEWMHDLGFWLSPEREAKLHCTVIYSATARPTDYIADPFRKLIGTLSHFEFWDGHDNSGYVVAKLVSPDLKERNRYWTERGAVHSFEDFTPHVTLLHNLSSTPAMLQRLESVGNRRRGENLVFYDEHLEDCKV